MVFDETEADLHRFETPEEAFQYLRHTGTLEEAEIDPGLAALALALVFLPGLHVDRYRQHLTKLGEQAREEYQAALRAGKKDTAALHAQVLRRTLHETQGYLGDAGNGGDLQDLTLIRVIERRKGAPAALGILYIAAARALRWDAAGLDFPGRFLLRLQKDGERLILDPFEGGKEMDAPALRDLLKSVAGKGAELSHSYYDPLPARGILLRLANGMKKRLIDAGEYAQALLVVETMQAFAPAEYRTLFDKAVLYVKLGQAAQAGAALEDYIARAPGAQDRRQALELLRQIRANPAL